MKLQVMISMICLWLICYGCDNRSLESLTHEEINDLLALVNEEDPAFLADEVVFDSIVTRAGIRHISGSQEKVKCSLYYYNDLTRGYFNLADRDEKNLQVFGKKIDDKWVIKCVTKINMEEVGGYIIMNSRGQGIWSNGHISFRTEKISLQKQNIDYNDLKSW